MKDRPRGLLLAVALLGGVAPLGLMTAGAAPSSASEAVTALLPFTVATPSGTWTTFPMGHLNDPLNTFWQLFFRPSGSSSWSNQVEATATATNGGLLLDRAVGGSLAVGIRPSENLTFSPVIASDDGGVSWHDGLISPGLADVPSALTTAASGHSLALVRSGHEVRVEASTGTNLSQWRTLLTTKQLNLEPGAARCEPVGLTAVGYLGEQPIVGTTCGRRGIAGLFAKSTTAWTPIGPRVLGVGAGMVRTVDLVSDRAGLGALFEVRTPEGDTLVVSRTTDGHTWGTSAPLALGRRRLVAVGTSGATQALALLERPGGLREVAVAEPAPGARWRVLAPAPAGTATLATDAGGGFDAISVAGSMATVYALAPGATKWVSRQRIRVSLQYGSSNP